MLRNTVGWQKFTENLIRDDIAALLLNLDIYNKTVHKHLDLRDLFTL